MRAFSSIGLVSLIAVAGCGQTAERTATERTNSAQAAIVDAPSGEAVLWQVRLKGAPAVDAWLESPPAERAARSRARLALLEREHAALAPEIAARGTIVGELTRLTNAWLVLATHDRAAELARLPDVDAVERAPLHSPSLASALPLTGAPRAWSGMNGLLGDGVTIGIIDSGIDYLHADFGGPGTKAAFDANDSTLIEPGSFPTARVIGGWDFAGNDYDATDPAKNKPKPDPDPIDCGSHGTHVAGIAAGNGVTGNGLAYEGPYDASLDLHAFRVSPGVAPRASLVALRVFGCGGSTGLVPLALERAADPDKNGDFSDRLDVVNLSLGSAYGLSSGTEAIATKKLVALGTVLVAAAGNEGDTYFVNGSPGTLPEALTVASSDDRAWLPLHVDSPSSIAGTIPAAEGPISQPIATSGTIAGNVFRAIPTRACSPIANAGQISGAIALIDRGDCPFVTKLQHAAAAGAVAAIVVDDEGTSEPMTMGGEGSVPLPAVLIRKKDGAPLVSKLSEGVTARLVPGERYDGPGSEPIAGYSSRGPSTLAFVLKPDVTAPGSDILSAQVGSGSGGVVMYGTSMACPMTAGAAALVRQAHPNLEPVSVKALLMNTASTLEAIGGEPFSLSRQGAGRIVVDAAARSHASVRAQGSGGDVSLSFGQVVAAASMTVSRFAVVENHGTAALTFALSTEAIDALPGVAVATSTPTLTVPGGASATFDVTLSLDPRSLGTPPPDALTPLQQFDLDRHHLNEAMGHVRLVAPGHDLRLPYYAVVNAAADRHAGSAFSCTPDDRGADAIVPILGSSAHPAPVLSAFELGTLDDEHPKSATEPDVAQTDVRAIGVASDVAAHANLADATLFFAVTTTGSWTTPARGPFSPVGLLLDVDSNPAFDFLVFAAPFAGEKPFGDALVTEIFNNKGQRVGERRFLNMVPATAADTAPFGNNVLVFPVLARDIGLGAETTRFRYAAFGNRPETPMFDEVTDWVTYDLAQPKIDTTALAPDSARPLFLNASDVRVRMHTDAIGDGPVPSLLLLHPNNLPGARWEAVPLDPREAEGLALTFDTRPNDRGHLVRRVDVENRSTHPIDGVTLTGSVSGGTLTAVAPTQGSCEPQTLACAIGTLAPGAVVSVSLTIESTTEVTVQLAATSGNGCTTATSGAIARLEPAKDETALPDGGCACGVGGIRPRARWPWFVVALAAAARRRRRP